MGQRSTAPDFIAYKHLDMFEVIVPVMGLSQGQTRGIKNDSCGIGVAGPARYRWKPQSLAAQVLLPALDSK